MKLLEVGQKYSAARRIFNSLLGVSSGDETLHLMFDILLHFWKRDKVGVALAEYTGVSRWTLYRKSFSLVILKLACVASVESFCPLPFFAPATRANLSSLLVHDDHVLKSDDTEVKS